MKKIIIAAAILLCPVIISSQQIANKQSPITVKDAWIRPSAKDANSALFFEVTNNAAAADTLLSAKSDLAEIVEVHETYKKENDMMGMREVEKVPVPAKSSVMFKPRGLHIMMIGLLKDLRIGTEGEAVLIFKNAGPVKVKAVVRDMPKMK